MDLIAPGIATIGFEDLLGGGDNDFDDALIVIRGDFSVRGVPDGGAHLLPLGLGALAMFGRFVRRRQA